MFVAKQWKLTLIEKTNKKIWKENSEKQLQIHMQTILH